MSLKSWAKTDIGLVRRSNQDAVGCFPEQGLFVVADGMGGHANGEVASRMAVDLLRAHLGARPEPTPEDLAAAVQVANAQIFDIGHRHHAPGLPSMGTTVVALALGRNAAWAHVGDSRLYRLRRDNLMLLTADDTRYGREIAPGSPIPLELPHTNELLCALGVERHVNTSLGEDELHPGDVYLLCSDGLSGLVPASVIHETLAGSQDPAVAGEILLARALEAGGNDNASVIIVRYS